MQIVKSIFHFFTTKKLKNICKNICKFQNLVVSLHRQNVRSNTLKNKIKKQ
nr:MAG TPA: hypothetical protein [Caudoviricetes sp.]